MEEEKTIGNSLHSAAEAGDVAEIESLPVLGFSIDKRDDEGRTPLMMAADNDKLQAVKYLLKQGADPSLQDNESRWMECIALCLREWQCCYNGGDTLLQD